MFLCLYFFFLYVIFLVDRFYIFWIIIEIRTLVFIGIIISIFKNKFDSLLLFFIIQSIAALFLLFSFCIQSIIFITMSQLLKLAIFPFYFWFLSIIPFFPNFAFFLSRTIFKLPSLLMLSEFYLLFSMKIVLISSILTLLVGSFLMIISSDFRFILICSSVANNSWLFFSQFVRVYFLSLYLTLYSFFLVICLRLLKGSVFGLNYDCETSKTLIFLLISTLAGLPPFPIFFVKMFIVLSLLRVLKHSFILIVLVFLRVLILVGYLKPAFSSLAFVFFSPSNLVLKAV